MTPKRRQRLLLVTLMLAGVSLAVIFGINAFRQNLMLFYSPTDVAAGNVDPGTRFRVGGMVVDGSVNRNTEDLAVKFQVSDTRDVVTISYTGILPDLFREGQGIVAQGKLDESGTFIASEVLAKHDENYMPPEVADALEKAGQMPGSTAVYGSTTLVDP